MRERIEDGPVGPQAGYRRAVGAVLVAALLVGGVWLVRRRPAPDAVTGSASRFTLGSGVTDVPASFERAARPDVTYRVTLASAPVGRTLRLDCAWRDPSGLLVRQNHYETREITTESWETHCHQLFGPEAPAGVWRVALCRGEHVLREDSFELR